MQTTPSHGLIDLLDREQLPASYAAMAEQWLLPLAHWLMLKSKGGNVPFLVGVNGAQGSGKTTLCQVLELLLGESGAVCLTLSLDDFYLTRAEREILATEVHPLLRTRGVPGTHDTTLLLETLDKLESGQDCCIPVFNKAIDDRRPLAQWREWQGKPDIILLEGWCVGCQPQTAQQLLQPVNTLEATEDPAGDWRRYVNDCLAGEYARLFARLHSLLMLKAPSMEQVKQWRQLQEQRLAQREHGDGLMSAPQLERFIQHYERLTLAALAEMPARADYLLELAADHTIQAGGAR